MISDFDIKHHYRALSISILLVMFVLSLIYIATSFSNDAAVKLELRKVSTLSIPPPAQPPKAKSESRESDIPLNVMGSGARIKIAEMQPITVASFEFSAQTIKLVQSIDIVIPNVDWQGFDLKELDDMPRLLTSAKINIPDRLKRKDSEKTKIKLEVSINEEGRVSLLRIVENSYPELNFEISEMVSRVRFTPPKRNGDIVKARFIWPLEVQL